MRHTLLPIHIAAGVLGLVAGFVALYAAKGATVHRKSGTVFVYAMITMALTGAVIAALKGSEGVALGGVLTAYLVITALITVRPLAGWSRWFDVGLMLVPLAVGLISLTWGFETLVSPTGRRDGLPAFPFLMTGVVGLLAATGDVRMIRSGALQGARRLARHLWRMCWGLWVASGSFFLGQAKVFPKPIRILPLLAILALLPLMAMVYWLWRVRVRRRYPAIIGDSRQQATSRRGASATSVATSDFADRVHAGVGGGGN
jgi:uncharacterized membrane protein